jgi:hypothetical protein
MKLMCKLAMIVAVTTVVSLVGGGTRAFAAPAHTTGIGPASASRWVEVTFTNKYIPLKLVRYSLPHGKWNVVPPDVIPTRSGTQGGVIWGSESNGFATGTEGNAEYSINDSDTQHVFIHWDNPYVGSNDYDCHGPDGTFCQWTGGGGNGARVKFTFCGGSGPCQ